MKPRSRQGQSVLAAAKFLFWQDQQSRLQKQDQNRRWHNALNWHLWTGRRLKIFLTRLQAIKFVDIELRRDLQSSQKQGHRIGQGAEIYQDRPRRFSPQALLGAEPRTSSPHFVPGQLETRPRQQTRTSVRMRQTLRLWFHRVILFRDAQPATGLGENHGCNSGCAVPLVSLVPQSRADFTHFPHKHWNQHVQQTAQGPDIPLDVTLRVRCELAVTTTFNLIGNRDQRHKAGDRRSTSRLGPAGEPKFCRHATTLRWLTRNTELAVHRSGR